MRWFHSIRWKLALSYIVVSLAPLAFFYNMVMAPIENHYINDRKHRLQNSADHVATMLERNNYIGLINEVATQVRNQYIDGWSRESGHRIVVFDDRLTVLYDTNRSQDRRVWVRPEVIMALTSQTESAISTVDREDHIIVMAMAIHNGYGQRVGAVLLSESVEDVFASLDVITQTLLLFILLAMVLVCVLVFFASQLLIGPLKGVLRVVQKMADGHLNQRIEIKGYDEYSQLGLAFNNMSEKLEQVDKAREEFVSNVSHELKTPLSAVKVLCESVLSQEEVPIEIYREFLADITSEVDRMTYMVNDLLELVKIDRREHGFHLTVTELNNLVEDILKRLSPLAEQKRIVLLYEDVRQVTLDADEMKLGLAISNIVENGIKYTPSGGTVKVIVDADHQNAIITVHDTGIGIPEEEQSKIYNRFYRVDKTRDRGTGGTGLGLAISHAAVRMHNGSLRLNSKLDTGSVFTIRVPLRRTSV